MQREKPRESIQKAKGIPNAYEEARYEMSKSRSRLEAEKCARSCCLPGFPGRLKEGVQIPVVCVTRIYE